MAWQGSYTALVTPMNATGDIAWDEWQALIERQCAAGIDGIVVAGTTGESPTLTSAEWAQLVETAVKTVAGRMRIIVGTGTYNTAHSVAATEKAKAMGADAALVVSSYYNKPPERGLKAHFESVAQVGLPVILYNHPGRTGIELSLALLAQLSQHPNIVAIKEVSPDLSRIGVIKEHQMGLDCLSGEDGNVFDFMKAGGDGVISISANVAPRRTKAVVDAARAEDWALAESAHQALMPLHQAMNIEVNPIPVKWALHQMGKISSGIRLPLCPLATVHDKPLRDVLTTVGVIHDETVPVA